MQKFFNKEKVFRIIDYLIYSLAFFIIINMGNHGLLWNKSRDEILFSLAMLLLFTKAMLNIKIYAKERDELHRQVDLEVYAKTYSLIIPILLIVSTVILRILGFDHEARILIIIVGLIFFTEKLVRQYIMKKYDVEYGDEE